MSDSNWTKEDLAGEIEQATNEKWSSSQYPLLLSELGMSLTKKKGDFRSVIAPLKLRQFIATQLSSKVVVITHPTQPQKIALIPVGEQFSFADEHSTAAPFAEKGERIKASIWAAFVKPLAPNEDRFLDVEDRGLRFQDLPAGSPPPSATYKQVSRNLITDGQGPSYDAQEVAVTIKGWAAQNGLPEERLYNREPRTLSGGSAFLELFRGLTDSELRRIDIPFDIVVKLISR